MEEEYTIEVYALSKDDEPSYPYFTMTIPVPTEEDPEEFIDQFLEDNLHPALYEEMEWDFI